MSLPFYKYSFNLNTLQKEVENRKKENYKVLAHKFSGLIKGNFLISILDSVISKIEKELPVLYNLKPTTENMVANGYEAAEYDVCKHIVGIHRSNLIFETVEIRKQLEISEEYRQELVKQVIAQVRLRYYGSFYFRLKPIVQGDSFIFFPVPYYSFVLCAKMIELLQTDKSANDLPCRSSFSQIANKGLAALSLLGDNFLDKVYPICRAVIEIYIKMLVLLNKPESLQQYIKFTLFELSKSVGSQNYPVEFSDLYKIRKHQASKNKVDYLHYGWVDTIEDYHSVVRVRPYSINGLFEYIRYLYPSKDCSYLKLLETLFKTLKFSIF